MTSFYKFVVEAPRGKMIDVPNYLPIPDENQILYKLGAFEHWKKGSELGL